jgi:uncharacterized protein
MPPLKIEEGRLRRAFLVLFFVVIANGALEMPVRGAAPPDPAESAAQPLPAEVSIPNTRQIEFVSKVNGHRYSISVALPFGSAPAKGYGVFYVLDGDNYFASAAEIARLFAAPDVIVVGIGYPDDPDFMRSVLKRRGPLAAAHAVLPPLQRAAQLERMYDLTLPVNDQDLAAEALRGYPGVKSANVGGLDDFLKTIETEVKPRVAALAPVDPANQALFGHSLGGLAVLHALFIEPKAFRTFIIASPSIFWHNRAVLADEAVFAAAVKAGQASPRVLVTIGGKESVMPRSVPQGVAAADLEAYLHKARMVENGAELVARLKALRGGAGYEVEDYTVFDQQTHVQASWPALARAISFAVAPPRAQR